MRISSAAYFIIISLTTFFEASIESIVAFDSGDTAEISFNRIPTIIYGTAWKKENTSKYVQSAIRRGFRGIDTAGQAKHYFEKGVGDALEILYKETIIRRSDLFIQTKFSPSQSVSDGDIPYDTKATLFEQVLQSFRQSQTNLRSEYIDSLLLHSPMSTLNETMQVWSAFELLHRRKLVRHIGISNIYDPNLLRLIYEQTSVKPSIVQNRFHRSTKFDDEIRDFCAARNINYQGFWTLTANQRSLNCPSVSAIAAKYGKTSAQVLYTYIQFLGVTILSGTTSEQHMGDDIDILLSNETYPRFSSGSKQFLQHNELIQLSAALRYF